MTTGYGISSVAPATSPSPRISASLARPRVGARRGPGGRGQSGCRRPPSRTPTGDPDAAATSPAGRGVAPPRAGPAAGLGFTLPRERLPEGRAKRRILCAVDQARAFIRCAPRFCSFSTRRRAVGEPWQLITGPAETGLPQLASDRQRQWSQSQPGSIAHTPTTSEAHALSRTRWLRQPGHRVAREVNCAVLMCVCGVSRMSQDGPSAGRRGLIETRQSA